MRTVLLVTWSLCAAACVGGDAPEDPFDLGVAAKSGSAGRPAVAGRSGGSASPGSPSAAAGSNGPVGGDPGEGPDSPDGPDIPDGPDGSQGPLPTPGSKESHYPLVDGASWTFHHVNPVKEPWDEVESMRATTWNGQAAFILSDQEDVQGEETRSTLLAEGSGVVRVYKETHVSGQLAVKTNYDPGFLRYDEAWTTQGETIMRQHDWAQECMFSSLAEKCSPGAIETGLTTHVYRIIDLHSQVTVPAGTFDAVQIEREKPEDPLDPGKREVKHYWFATGIGKIREENIMTGSTEELTAYEVP